MNSLERRHPCEVRDDNFVVPCTALEESIGGFGTDKRKGIVAWHLIHMPTGKPSRSFIGVRSGDHAVKGVAFNFCPFCGTKIDAPFNRDATT